MLFRSHTHTHTHTQERLKQRESWVSKRDGQVKALESVLIAREKKVRELEGGAEHLATRYQVLFLNIK